MNPNTIAFFWLGLAIVFAIAEAYSFQLIAIWFAVAAAITIVPAYMGVSFSNQLVIFALLSAVAVAATRPLVKKLAIKKTSTNADSFIGKMGVVTVDIDPITLAGRVVVSGSDWWAVSADTEFIAQGETICVKNIEGAKLVVERVV